MTDYVPEFIEDDRPYIVSESGEIITAEELDALAEKLPTMEFDLDKIRPRGRPLLGDAPSKIFQVRLDPALSDKLNTRAQQDNTTRSEILRRALDKYLAS